MSNFALVCILCKRPYGFLPEEEGGEFCDCDLETLELLKYPQREQLNTDKS